MYEWYMVPVINMAGAIYFILLGLLRVSSDAVVVMLCSISYKSCCLSSLGH